MRVLYLKILASVHECSEFKMHTFATFERRRCMYVCMYGLRQNVEQRVGPQLGFVLLLDFVEKGLTWDIKFIKSLCILFNFSVLRSYIDVCA